MFIGYSLFSGSVVKLSLVTGLVCALIYGDRGMGMVGYLMQPLRNEIVKRWKE